MGEGWRGVRLFYGLKDFWVGSRKSYQCCVDYSADHSLVLGVRVKCEMYVFLVK